ncbi:tetratricopeptide repeat protein [candidate division KSB1 bacterium]|nr:tetratricopeptide repeat protein [candidate division KSB1 bacterium]
MKNAKTFIALLAAFLLPVLALAQNIDLGEIDFPTSGSPEAQNYFIKGVLLLHSFEYEDAAEEFREAQKRDPDFAMAYWGEAMTHNHPIWMQVNLEKARAVLNRLAPAAAHALHMPSHIFFAMGMWDEAVATNEESWAAAEARRERKSLPLQERGYHALLWREYAYLQQGRYQEAKAMFAIMAQDAKKTEHGRIRFHLAAMRAAYVVNTRLWNSEAARLEVKTDGLEKDAIAGDLFVRGMCAVENGELRKAEKILAEIEALRPASVTPSASATVGMQCHALPAESANYPPAVQAVNIMAKELRALIQMSEGKTDEALQLLKAAASDEDRMSFDFGPPVVVKPARELLGEMLLKLDRSQEAQVEFASSLKRTPKRFLSLLGMARAATKSGDHAAAQETYATLEKVLHRADAEMVELAEVKKGVTKRL